MTSRSLASLLAVVFIYGLFSTTDARDLVFVQALWRHGDRAPLSMPYPNDPYNETAWIRGWKQLTNIGMQQLSELGTYFRKKYGFFISSQYIPSEVYIRASDSDRSLTSAQSFLFGFYPAAGAFQWQTNNPWQPIPIHATTPDEPDLLIKPTATKCEKYDDEVQKEDEAQAVVYNAKYAEMFQFLGNATGIANFSYPNVNKVYDIQRELNNGMTAKQPAWVFKNWTQYDNRSTMDIITELRTYRMITQFNSTEKAKMIAGYLLNNWIQNANQVANGTMTSPKKMLLYSSVFFYFNY
ncbi:unnamed protein product [Nippostrongylus brasiliensis]|uniref:Lysosomal acid phosphatase n=1 Tax=Nippostrongylus brasiliensis TaxID=27835 RepID=A0A158R3G7_NIPBR|nr:unnamed protein product [Nippostrongylus brasiliensis]